MPFGQYRRKDESKALLESLGVVVGGAVSVYRRGRQYDCECEGHPQSDQQKYGLRIMV
jgi:hypothetical protein